MASSTTNLGLIKPAGNEKIRIAQINQNSDTIDNAIGAVGSTSLQAQVSAIEDGIAIVANGDSHVAITAGQFVYVRNNTHNLADGLYVASANVSANASITSSNMTADASGGLNALNAKISEKAYQIKLTGDSSNWAANYAKINSLGATETATVFIEGGVVGYISNGGLPTANADGVVTKVNPSLYDFTLNVAGGVIGTVRLEGASSSGLGTVTVYNYYKELIAISNSLPTKYPDITDGTLDNAFLHKVGNVVYASGRLHSFTATSASGYFFMIPEGYRPKNATRVSGYMSVIGVGFIPMLVSVYPSGIVELSYSSSSTTNQVGFSGCWSVD